MSNCIFLRVGAVTILWLPWLRSFVKQIILGLQQYYNITMQWLPWLRFFVTQLHGNHMVTIVTLLFSSQFISGLQQQPRLTSQCTSLYLSTAVRLMQILTCTGTNQSCIARTIIQCQTCLTVWIVTMVSSALCTHGSHGYRAYRGQHGHRGYNGYQSYVARIIIQCQ